MEIETELILLREENSRLKSVGEGKERRIKDLEDRLVNAEAANNSLNRKIGAFNHAKVTLENELDEKELLLNQQKKDQKRNTKKYRQHLAQQEHVNNELATRLKHQQSKFDLDEIEKAKLNAVRNIVNQDQAKYETDSISTPKYSSKRQPLAPVTDTSRPRRVGVHTHLSKMTALTCLLFRVSLCLIPVTVVHVQLVTCG